MSSDIQIYVLHIHKAIYNSNVIVLAIYNSTVYISIFLTVKYCSIQ
jgi:hypothetical protein